MTTPPHHVALGEQLPHRFDGEESQYGTHHATAAGPTEHADSDHSGERRSLQVSELVKEEELLAYGWRATSADDDVDEGGMREREAEDGDVAKAVLGR